MANHFKINFLDHVAINVSDMQVSISWYEKVLGLKKYRVEGWGDFPIFMLSGKTGVALFPADTSLDISNIKSKSVKIDHFAFNVDRNNFNLAIERYKELHLEFEIKDHIYFDSLYTLDPDGHTVELTTLKVAEDEFYGFISKQD